jgi:hypothetical protein
MLKNGYEKLLNHFYQLHFVKELLSPPIYVIVNMFAMFLPSPHALTLKKFPSSTHR